MGDAENSDSGNLPAGEDGDYERGYVEGNRTAWLYLLRQCLMNLGEDDREKYAWIVERQETVATLRRICAEFGDNDWPDDLHLRDVVEKHLGEYLEGGVEDDHT